MEIILKETGANCYTYWQQYTYFIICHWCDKVKYKFSSIFAVKLQNVQNPISILAKSQQCLTVDKISLFGLLYHNRRDDVFSVFLMISELWDFKTEQSGDRIVEWCNQSQCRMQNLFSVHIGIQIVWILV